MGVKSRRTIGLICLIFSGLLLAGEIFVLTIPALAQIDKQGLGDHFTSLVMVFVTGVVGLYLRVQKSVDLSSFFLKVVIFILLLTPLLSLQTALKVVQEHHLVASFPQVRPILIGLSFLFVVVPYVFGKPIIKYQSTRRVSKSSVTPKLALYIIGLACALLPSTAAFFSVLLGLPFRDTYWFTGISYIMCGIWSVWWRYRYSNPLRDKVD
jgi:uncharacterized membrane protein